MRLNGYHDFHRATAVHKGVPLYVVTVWNVAIAAIQTLIQQYYGDNFGEHCVQRWLSPVVFVTTFALVETAVLAFVHGTYIGESNHMYKPDCSVQIFTLRFHACALQPV